MTKFGHAQLKGEHIREIFNENKNLVVLLIYSRQILELNELFYDSFIFKYFCLYYLGAKNLIVNVFEEIDTDAGNLFFVSGIEGKKKNSVDDLQQIILNDLLQEFGFLLKDAAKLLITHLANALF